MEAVKTTFQRHLLAGAEDYNMQCINDITTYFNVKRVDLKSIYYLCNMVTSDRSSVARHFLGSGENSCDKSQ